MNGPIPGNAWSDGQWAERFEIAGGQAGPEISRRSLSFNGGRQATLSSTAGSSGSGSEPAGFHRIQSQLRQPLRSIGWSLIEHLLQLLHDFRRLLGRVSETGRAASFRPRRLDLVGR